MFLLKVVELMLILLFLVGVATQVFYPLFSGTTIFPIFGKQADLEKHLAEKKQRLAESRIQEEIKTENEKGA